MLIPLANINLCFEKIKKKSEGSQATVVIFVSYDADALCACQILTTMLKSESILYRIYPVSGFTEMEAIIDGLNMNINVKSFVFLNCGAIVDMTEKWMCAEDQKVKCYIFDNHRPIHHNNIFTKKVVIIEDDSLNLEDCPAPEDLEESDGEIAEFSEDDENYLEEEDEFDNDNEAEAGERKGLQEGNEEDEDLEMIDIGRKRKKNKILEKKMKKKLKTERRRKIENYYRASFHGNSIACMMYTLSEQLNKDNNDFLWWAILGLTDMFIHGKMTSSGYQDIVNTFNPHVYKHNSPDFENVNPNMAFEEKKLKSNGNKKEGTIFVENDFRFMLLRHWNLYDSMFYSTYLAPRLGIWRENGKKELNKLIAKLGIPLEEAQQKYRYMKSHFKDKLKDELLSNVTNMDISEVLFVSYMRQFDPKIQISASDIVYCLTAILSFPKTLLDEKFQHLYKEDSNSSLLHQDKSLEIIENKNHNFWRAYDILQGKNLKWIEEGIDMAIDFQKALINEAIFLLDKGSVTACSDFRFCVVNSDTVQEKKFFSHPISLQKLAVFLMEIHQIQKKELIPKPVVICYQNNTPGTYLYIGVVGASSYSNVNKNEFGNRFARAANELKMKVRQDDFETSIIEISKEDHEAFIEKLTEK